MYRLLAGLMPKAGNWTFTFVGSCVSNSTSLDFSSLSAGSIAADDLAVYIDCSAGGSTPSAVTPSGFTNHINTTLGGALRGMVSTKKLLGSEGVITGMNSVGNNKVGLVFRPSTPFTTVNALGISSEATTGDPASQVCDPSAETTSVILIGISASDLGTAAFSTFSPAADGTVATADADLLVGYNIFNTAPQSTAIDMGDLGAPNWLASLYLTVS